MSDKVDLEHELKEGAKINQAMVDTMSKIGVKLAEQTEEMNKIGKSTLETGTKMDKLDTGYVELKEQYTQVLERLRLVESEDDRPGGLGSKNRAKSLGELVAHGEELKEALGESGSLTNREFSMKIDSFERHMKSVTSDAASAGDLVEPFRDQRIWAQPNRPERVRDLFPVGTTNSNAVEYIQETGFANLYTVLTAAIAAAETVLPVANTAGFYPGQPIQVGTESRIVDAGGVDQVALTVTITAGVTGAWALGTGVTANEFTATAETMLKPQMNLTFDVLSQSVKTLAHYIMATRQILDDAGQLRAHIDARLLYGLALSEDRQLMYGDGTGNNLQGIMTNASAQQYAWSSGPTGDTKVDAIRRSMTLSRLAEYPVDGVVLNPQDWEDIELLKGSDKHYIWVSVPDGGVSRVWRAPVVETTAIDATDFLVGAFRNAMIWDREQSNIRMSESHDKTFAQNMVTILAEERLTMTTMRPEGFVVGDFDNAPA